MYSYQKRSNAFVDRGECFVRMREYQLQYEHKQYRVQCPEIHSKTPIDEPRVYLPAYKLPHRPYPLGVYLYAIWLYSTNLSMGQREAAEETRKYFGLETFSHTTLGRAMLSLTKVITQYLSDKEAENPFHDDSSSLSNEDSPAVSVRLKQDIPAGKRKEQPYAPVKGVSEGKNTSPGRHFPCVEDTRKRRLLVASFLLDRLKQSAKTAFLEECNRLALEWFVLTNRLLL